MNSDTLYMRRALALAVRGEGTTGSNPMVGAVVVSPDGRIIGEGWHRRYGEGHAEVNALASVAEADRHLLPESTIYVTLEPCSHYGKTPPCSLLIIREKLRRVVVGAVDPFERVAGRGIAMLREAGIEVTTGVLADECRALNRRFFTAHTLARPYVVLKWARSADGWMDRRRTPNQPAARFSTPLTSMLAHRLRAVSDAIVVGAGTVVADHPRLDCRLWPIHYVQPRPVVLDPHRILSADDLRFAREPIVITEHMPVADLLAQLYAQGITSVLVEGGSSVLASFIESGVWDLAREEIAPIVLGSEGVAPAPHLPFAPTTTEHIDGNTINTYTNPTKPFIG